MRTMQFGPLPRLSPDFEGAGGGAAETNPATDGASGAPEGEEVSTQPEGDGQGYDDGEGGDAQPEADAEEIEHDGQKYKLPKALKPLLMMQQDYTRKTQETAEQRRALETERQTFAQQAEAHQANIREVARLVNIDGQLEQFKAVNWQELERSDPLHAQSLWRQYQQLKDARQELAGQLSQKAAERSREAERERATRLEEAGKTLAREIKGWSPKLAQELTEFGTQAGLSAQELTEMNLHPHYVKLLHMAFVGQQLLNKQLSAAKAAKPAVDAAPVPQVGRGQSPATKDPGRMSTTEWMAWRNKQTSKR